MKIRTIGAAVAAAVCFAAGAALAGRGPAAMTDLKDAMKQAKDQNKLLFVKYGREACGNCQALQRLIDKGDVKLPEGEFVFANISCDDEKQSRLFQKEFKVGGGTLPFVVIADSSGKVLATRKGSGKEKDFKAMIDDAKKSAGR